MRPLRIELEIAEAWNKQHQNPRPDHESWRRNFEAVLQRAHPLRTWLNVKEWNGYTVDYELRDEWLEGLNHYVDQCGVMVHTVCAGHPHGISGMGMGSYESRGPGFGITCYSLSAAYEIAPVFSVFRTRVQVTVDYKIRHRRYMVFVRHWLHHSGKNQDRLAQWWEKILTRFRRYAEEEFRPLDEFLELEPPW